MKLLILYDGNCPICLRKKAFLERHDKRGKIEFSNLRDPHFDAARHGRTLAALAKEIHAVGPDGTLYSGMDAIRAAWREIGLGWLVAPTTWPGLKALFDALYSWVARHRLQISRFFR